MCPHPLGEILLSGSELYIQLCRSKMDQRWHGTCILINSTLRSQPCPIHHTSEYLSLWPNISGLFLNIPVSRACHIFSLLIFACLHCKMKTTLWGLGVHSFDIGETCIWMWFHIGSDIGHRVVVIFCIYSVYTPRFIVLTSLSFRPISYKAVLIIGHSTVFWPAFSGQNSNLGLGEYLCLSCLGHREMKCLSLLSTISTKVFCHGPPHTIIIQLGENDLSA